MLRYLIILLLPLTLFSQTEEKRLALVIGNSNYDKGPLNNPVNDALLMAQTLDSLDFDVILDTNIAKRGEFLNTIREFGNKRSDYDVAFVYYAGHGIQVGAENFLLPTKENFETEYDVMDNGVSVQNIMRYLTGMTNQVNILVLDACRDNPFEGNWNKTRSLKGGGLAKIPPPTGSLIAFSTDAGNTAADGDGENSVYCQSLCENMMLENTSLDQVFRNVRSDVLKQTNGNQRPVEASQLTGNAFYLNYSEYQVIKNLSKVNCFENLEFSTDSTLDIITWNIEFFPKANNTVKKLSEIIKSLNADIIAFQEIYDRDEFFELSKKLSNYSAIATDKSALNLGFLVKNNIQDPVLYPLDFDKYNFMRTAIVLTFKFLGQEIYVFNLHHKCCGDGVLDMDNNEDEEFRRYKANQQMTQFLEYGYDKNGIVLGDFNDLLEDPIGDNTMTPFLSNKETYLITDYDMINLDPSNWSFPNWPAHLDHIIINKKLFDNFKIAGSYSKTIRVDKCFESFENYDNVISDHLPVGIRLFFNNSIKYNQQFFKFY